MWPNIENGNEILARQLTEQYRTPEHQMVPTAGSMKIGEIRFVDEAHILIEPTDERKVWIYRFAPALELEETALDYFNNFDDDNDVPAYARVIRVNDGYIIDQSHHEHTDWRDVNDRFNQLGAQSVLLYPQNFLPVVYRAFATEEMTALEPVLEAYNISLEGTQMEDVFQLAMTYSKSTSAAEEILSVEEDEDDDGEPADGAPS